MIDWLPLLSCVRLFATPWTVAYQAPLSIGFSTVVLEWIAISFSMGSSRPRDRTRVSCIVDRRFTVWATREDPVIPYSERFRSKCVNFTQLSRLFIFLQPRSVPQTDFHFLRSLADYIFQALYHICSSHILPEPGKAFQLIPWIQCREINCNRKGHTASTWLSSRRQTVLPVSMCVSFTHTHTPWESWADS